MAVNFAEIGKKIAALGLPLLANAIVPGGGAVVSMIASALGLTDSTPDAIAQALQTNPDAAIRLKELEARHTERLEEIALQGRQAELTAQTAQQGNINRTMQAELNAPSKWKSGWRPLFGYMAALGFGGLLAGLIVAVFKEPGSAGKLVESATIILTMMLAVLGVNIRSRSQDKQAAIPGRPIGLIEAFATRLSK